MQALRTTLYVLFAVATVIVGQNQHAAMVGDYEQAIMGWVGFGLPFAIAGVAYCLGRTHQ